jgi:hypothetical protein
MQSIRNFIPRNSVYYLFLSEHSKIRAVEYIVNSNNNNDKSCQNVFSKNNHNNRMENKLVKLNRNSSYVDIITYEDKINGNLRGDYNSTVVYNSNGNLIMK